MPHYQYTAMDAGGKTVKSIIEAESQQALIGRLRDGGFHVLDVVEAKGPKAASLRSKGKMKPKSLVVFSRQFATMIDAGIPMLRCLEILGASCKDPVLKAAIESVTLDVKGGSALNEALTKHPHVFSKLYINMVRAAELGGILDIILDRLSGFLEYEMEVRGKIKSAMMYPVMVLGFSILMLFVLFSFVLPRFKEIFSDMDAKLPPLTNTLFNFGDFMAATWWMQLLFWVAVFAGYKWYGRTEKGRYNLDYMKLRFPIIGDLALKMSVARFTRTFGTLINSGVPMMRSLEIVGETLNNSVLTLAVDNTRLSIREGNRLSTPLSASGLFPQMVTQMIDIGEESGRLSEMLVKIGDFYDEEVSQTVKGLTSMIEPMLIIFMGVIVGFIAISVMSPIFTIVNEIK
ncbi:MAG: type II secretion system F family protein [Fimbriimonadaceae bacterium]|nr:type II secretion system F family protein [Fimbriimonadaceae bacterium]